MYYAVVLDYKFRINGISDFVQLRYVVFTPGLFIFFSILSACINIEVNVCIIGPGSSGAPNTRTRIGITGGAEFF